uniref:Helicase-associated domain-containing protein n=1 Tax=Pseudictyota dubia TaxID=2749911 RepID=A0A7R9Z738_9STRA|mmetsp:Transcript_25049/g.46417  ORF Transcript_25049/g.46417 Transcript_25049/m.46417 type:complete len:1144 (+) Transcript_25049:154-3585(+)
MSWYNQGQFYNTDQRHHSSQTYANQPQPQHQQQHHGTASEMTRLEALQLIGELGQDEQQLQEEQYQTAPLAKQCASPAMPRKRSRDRRSPLPSSLDEGWKKPTARKKRKRGELKRGELRAEAPASSAFKATKHRKHTRAEIQRVYGMCIAWGLSKADREAMLAEQNHKGDESEEDGDNSDEDGLGEKGTGAGGRKETAKGGEGYPELLPEKDDLPFLPLFAEPSYHLDALYDEVESALEDREGTWSAIEDANAELKDARRRLKEAVEEDAQMKAALEEAKDRARAAELEEPCLWNDMMQRLRDFHAAYGHVNIPSCRKIDREQDPGMYELARFDLSLKDRYKRGTLQRYPHRLKAVEELGFNWGERQEDLLEHRLEQLRQFKEKHGHCDVTRSDGKELYRWVGAVRVAHKTRTSGKKAYSKLSQSRYEKKLTKLREILGGEDAFNEWINSTHVRNRGGRRAEVMRVHREEMGHCVHPDPAMRRWVVGIRAKYQRKKEGRLYPNESINEGTIEALTDVGFCWTDRCTCEGAPKDQGILDDGSSDDTDEETDIEEGLETGADDSRTSLQKKKLSKKRRRSIRKRSDKAWNKWIDRLKAYKAEHGHSLVERKIDSKLHDWFYDARVSYNAFQQKKEEKRNGVDEEGAETDYPQSDDERKYSSHSRSRKYERVVMTEARASELEEFVSESRFSHMFKLWNEHKQKEGNCNHPDKKVMKWLRSCKNRRKKEIEGLQAWKKSEDEKNKERKTQSRAGPNTEGFTDSPEMVKRKKRKFTPLSPHEIELLDAAGVCWGYRCHCGKPDKKAELARGLKGKPQTPRTKQRSFDGRLAEFKEYKKKTGHCVHPDQRMRDWISVLKGRRRATLEKRLRDAEGENHDSTNDDVCDEVVGDEEDELRKKQKNRERLNKGGKYLPFCEKTMAKIEDLDICWGRGCQCTGWRRGCLFPGKVRPEQICNTSNDFSEVTPISELDADGNFGKDATIVPGSFDEMLAFFVVNRTVNGGCHSGYPQVQQWYQDMKTRYMNQKRCQKRTLTDTQMTALEASGICLENERCSCRKQGNLKTPLDEMCQAETRSEGEGNESEPPVRKTVAELSSSELEKLSTEVVEEIRKKECWSSDEFPCSSEDESSSGDDSSISESSTDDVVKD